MGVDGLWPVLEPAEVNRSLLHLAVTDGFIANRSGNRALKVGIDTSIWFFSSSKRYQGENPELSILYSRCCRLLALPVLPLFVFDGPNRPSKRGNASKPRQHWLESGMKEMVDAFGFSWWTAPGEAEAELAYLNRIGVIDAVMSDDVDTFVFGAETVWRSPTSARSRSKKGNKKHLGQVSVYTADAIDRHCEIGVSRPGLILIALLSGGDYSPGVPGVGMVIAHACARACLGEDLINEWNGRPSHHSSQLLILRNNVSQAVAGPSLVSDLVGHCNPKRARAIYKHFPSSDIVDLYINPVTSQTTGRDANSIDWPAFPFLPGIGRVSEKRFEWGIQDVILKRARTMLWTGVVLRLLRAISLQDSADPIALWTSPPSSVSSSPPAPTSTSPTALLADLAPRIVGSRTHHSTQQLLEYRFEFDTTPLDRQITAGLEGSRHGLDGVWEESSGGEGLDRGVAEGRCRVWMPAAVVDVACPDLVEAFESKERGKQGVTKRTKHGAPTSPGYTSNATRNAARLKQSPVSTPVVIHTPFGDDNEVTDLTSDGEMRGVGTRKEVRAAAVKGKEKEDVIEISSDDEEGTDNSDVSDVMILS